MSFKISLKDKSFHISRNSIGLYLSPECLLNFLGNFYIPPCVGKVFKFMEFTFLENALIEAFLFMPHPTQNLSPRSCHHAIGRRKLLIPPASILSKIYFPQQHHGWRKLWFALSKFSQKTWRWLGTLDFLYFVWFTIFSNVMALQFCK